MKVLGISAFYHDSAAVLIENGEIVRAAQEERFSRVKHDARFPRHAIEYCLDGQSCDLIVFFEKPFLKFERLLETYLAFAPKGFMSFMKAMPVWIKSKLFQKKELIKELSEWLPEAEIEQKLIFSDHHLSHAASAYYASPFDDAVILTMDGVGEWATTTVAIGEGKQCNIIKEIKFPHSLGLLYSAFTYYCGFKVNSGEYKLMGLAPYGEPKYVDLIKKHLIDIKADGSFRLDQRYFNYCTGLTMTNTAFEKLFGQPRRASETELTQFYMDMAASVQQVTEEVVLKLASYIRKQTGKRNLCLAGGVALNCVANGKLSEAGIFDEIWIQPAAGDAGGALGAAYVGYHQYQGHERSPLANRADRMNGAYLGSFFSDAQIKQALDEIGAVYLHIKEDKQLIETIAEYLAEQKAVGWMQGRMEFGPRALGGRSIIADPRSPTMQKLLNLKVKYRESFRPFAPSVKYDQAKQWFDLKSESPYMLLVAQVNQQKLTCVENELTGLDKLKVARSEVPAITHVDNSARVQTVSPETNPLYYQLIDAFEQKTDCPLLINTSFNVRGEPIVCSPADSYRCFMGTEIEVLVMGHYVCLKAHQPQHLIKDYKSEFALD